MPPAKKTLKERPDVVTHEDPPIDARLFTGLDGRLRVVMAGLLASDPKLAERKLPRAEWQKKLNAYLRSPRP